MTNNRATNRKYYPVRKNSGVLFLVDSPKGKQPNMRGTIRIGDIYYDISGWFHNKKNSEQQYLALRVKKQTERPTKGRGTPIASSYKYYLRSNEGMLFPLPLLAPRNSDDGHPKPSMRGTLNVDGTLYDLSAWINSSKNPENKNKFLSLNLTRHDSTREYLLESILGGDPRHIQPRTRSQRMPVDADIRESSGMDTPAEGSGMTGTPDPSPQYLEPEPDDPADVGMPQEGSFSYEKAFSPMMPDGKESGHEETASQPDVPLPETSIVTDGSPADSGSSQDGPMGCGTSFSTHERKNLNEGITGTVDWPELSDQDDLPF